eukprot:5080091-Prymnesium_polylepis.1
MLRSAALKPLLLEAYAREFADSAVEGLLDARQYIHEPDMADPEEPDGGVVLRRRRWSMICRAGASGCNHQSGHAGAMRQHLEGVRARYAPARGGDTNKEAVAHVRGWLHWVALQAFRPQ